MSLIPTHRWEDGDPVHGSRLRVRPVKINLRGLFQENLESGVKVVDGLDVDCIVDGLTSGWWDSLNNSQLVLVNYAIPSADPHGQALQLTDQVVSSRWVRTVR
ncbi:hypothetical protein [Lentzea flava]|uniref:Uncharacterized protein n=1 Tax=Lentzea flava TaxID=103732 RepID=A0ABQ2UPN3_9PSEU|nr:hypothetical protein [Lentzea flava]MCP2200022.1 hypothetical protein [Lentzea flava]GGU45614.1 hypothetical protein GCM10010178_42560 [Lentzea flava]